MNQEQTLQTVSATELKPKRILHNRVQCLQCEDVIESKHRYDFVWCECQAIFTDGGHECIRRGGQVSLMRDLTEYSE